MSDIKLPEIEQWQEDWLKENNAEYSMPLIYTVNYKGVECAAILRISNYGDSSITLRPKSALDKIGDFAGEQVTIEKPKN